MARIMNVFYGGDCLPYKDKERQVHFPILNGNTFNGSSMVDTIHFYVKDIGGVNDITWVANVKRADGKLGYKQLSASYDSEIGEWYVSLSLSQWFTAKNGDIFISLNGYEGGLVLVYDSDSQVYTSVSGTPVIQATGCVKLNINYSVQMNNDYGELPMISVQEALALVSSKLDKNSSKYFKVIDSISNINTSGYSEFLNDGDLIYAQSQQGFYKIIESSETFSASLMKGEFDTLTTDILNANTINVQVSGYTNVEISGFGYQGYNALSIGANTLFVANDLRASGQGKFANGLDCGTNLKLHTDYGKIITQQNATYGFTLEDTTSFTSDRVLATQDYTYSKAQTDSLIASVKANAFEVVEELPSVGEEGIIYLVETSTDVYEQYIWEDGAYIDLGTTSIDLSGYVQKTNSANKVYATDNSGLQTTITYGQQGANAIVQRDSNGFIKQTNTPLNNNDVPNKQYVDGAITIASGFKVDKTTTIAGIDLQNNISAQDLTNALVFMNITTDIDYVMGD